MSLRGQFADPVLASGDCSCEDSLMSTEHTRLTRVIDALHSAGFAAALTELVLGWIDADCALLLGLGRRPVYLHDTLPDRRELLFARYLTGAFRQDPFLQALGNHHEAAAWTLAEVVQRTGIDPDYMTQFYAETGWQEEVGIVLPLRHDFRLLIFLGRLTGSPPLASRQLATLRQRLPLLLSLCQQHWQDQPAPPLPTAPGPSAALLRSAIEQAMASLGSPHLTRREQEVAQLILHGLDTEQIAERLAIGTGTVRNHRKHLYAKLGLASRGDLFTLFLHQLLTRAQ